VEDLVIFVISLLFVVPSIMKTNPGRAYTPDARFIGFQENVPGKPRIPLYNVIKKHHFLYHSTVSAQTLINNHLKVPNIGPKGPFHKINQTKENKAY